MKAVCNIIFSSKIGAKMQSSSLLVFGLVFSFTLSLDSTTGKTIDSSSADQDSSSNFTNPNFILPTTAPLLKQLPPRRRSYEDEPGCYPKPVTGQPQYLIGYGSLMQKDSKDRTDPRTGESIPVNVFGYNRIWNCKGDSVGFSTTYLGVKTTRSQKAYFNAVVFKLASYKSLTEFDSRESFYCREEVPLSRLQRLATGNGRKNQELPMGQYWIYVTKPKNAKLPSKKYPIVQSYVDTFLTGCFELEEKYDLDGFAEDCVTTTKEWWSPWVNDRIYPRRPFLHVPYAGKIDALLSSKVQRAFQMIHLET